MAKYTNQITSIRNRSNANLQTTEQYVEELYRLQKMKQHQQLQIHMEDREANKEAIRSVKAEQTLRMWYIEDTATAIMLDLDHQDFNDIVDTWNTVCLYVPAIITTTSTDGVHIIVPTKKYQKSQQQHAAKLFCERYGIRGYDASARGGHNRGFYDPRWRIQPVQIYLHKESCKYDTSELNLSDIIESYADNIELETVVGSGNVSKKEQCEASANNHVNTFTTNLNNWWTEHKQEVVVAHQQLLQTKNFKNIKHVECTAIENGTVFSYVTGQGKRCRSVCYMSGQVKGTSWDAKDVELQWIEPLGGFPEQIRSYLFHSLRSLHLQRCDVKWYDVDGEWVKVDRVVTALTGIMMSGQYSDNYTDFRIIILKWINEQHKERMLIPTSIPDWNNDVDVKHIWKEFGQPETLHKNIHVLRFSTKEPKLLDLGGPVNGHLVGIKNWVYRTTEYRPSEYDIEYELAYIASRGYTKTWSKKKFFTKLHQLPETIQVILPKPCRSKSLEKMMKHARYVTCTRQIIHAASLRGCQVVVHVNLNQHPKFFGTYYISQKAVASAKKLVEQFRLDIPKPNQVGKNEI